MPGASSSRLNYSPAMTFRAVENGRHSFLLASLIPIEPVDVLILSPRPVVQVPRMKGKVTMRTRLFVSLTCILGPVSASFAPNSTGTSKQIVGYVQDPDGRGTISLLISCMLTLVLCVWSALHLNVPGPNHTWAKDVWLNTRWIIAGIYAPELVVFVAWRQWCSARLLQQVINEETRALARGGGGDNDEDGSSYKARKMRTWTMTDCFFASTGGFAFEIDELDTGRDGNDDERRVSQRLTLTARGMALLARCGHIPDIDEEDIRDKSKANNLAKSMVIIQATWMLIQAIGRLAARLPVTPLEVNTIAHVYVYSSKYLDSMVVY
jgi:hypothetical protein